MKLCGRIQLPFPGGTITGLILALPAVTCGCGSSVDRDATPPPAPAPTTASGPGGSLTLRSSDFQNNQPIPARLTCDGANQPPQIVWSGAPKSVKSFALTVVDPDAPGGEFTHWLVFNLPGTATALSTGSGVEGKNDFGKVGYGGPCPPSGEHHYVFTLYALDQPRLLLSSGASRAELEKAISGHVIGQGRLTGLYRRK